MRTMTALNRRPLTESGPAAGSSPRHAAADRSAEAAACHYRWREAERSVVIPLHTEWGVHQRSGGRRQTPAGRGSAQRTDSLSRRPADTPSTADGTAPLPTAAVYGAPGDRCPRRTVPGDRLHRLADRPEDRRPAISADRRGGGLLQTGGR